MPALTWKRILASLLPASFLEMAVNAVPVLQREWTGKETALGEICWTNSSFCGVLQGWPTV